MKKKKTSKIQTNISLLSELLVLDGGVNCGLHPQGKSAMTDMMGRIWGPELASRIADTSTGFSTLKHRTPKNQHHTLW